MPIRGGKAAVAVSGKELVNKLGLEEISIDQQGSGWTMSALFHPQWPKDLIPPQGAPSLARMQCSLSRPHARVFGLLCTLLFVLDFPRESVVHASFTQ